MDQEKIGKFIKDLRIKNELTQSEFAESLGVTYQAVSKWETGKNMPDIAILKIISKKYGVDINEILEGQSIKKKKNKMYLLYIVILLLLSLGIILKINHREFEFKNVVSACDDYKINGIAAYDSKKSSLYITNIEYCGEKNDTVYNNVSCTLYEEYGDTTVKISECEKNSDVTIEKYLKNITIKVDSYDSICKNFKDSKLYLKINANNSNSNYSYDIPLKIETNCKE